jgi:ligand-binding sensor domain-containing protein
MRLALFLIVFFSNALVAEAQSKTRAYTYTTEQGLSENVVYSVLQDTEGFIWAGTHHGLNRFDGYAWKNFYHSNYDSLSLPDNVIFAIEQDDDDLWLSSNKGVIRFSKKTFRSSLVYPSDSKTRSSSYHMARLNDSLIAVSYIDFVGMLNTNTNLIVTLKSDEKKGIINIDYNRFFRTGDGKICFAAEQSDSLILFQVDQNLKRVRRVDLNRLFPFKPIGPVSNYFIDELNHHWAFYDRIGWRVYDHTGRPDEITLVELPTTVSTSSYVTYHEKVWLSSNTGVICYDMNTRTSKLINNRDHNILVNKVYCMIIDRQHNIWAGTFGGGLSKLVTSDLTSNYGYYNQPEILMGNMITGIKKLKSGNLLINDFTNYEIHDPKFNKIESGTVKNDIQQFLKLGLEMDEEEFNRSYIWLKELFKKTIDPVFLYARTDTKGRIYQNSKIYEKTGRLIINIPGSFTKIVTDKWDNTWAATSTGLYKILPDNSVRGIGFPKNRKPGELIFIDALFTDDSTLWLATQEGLLKMMLPSMKYIRYDVGKGLPDNYIYQIQEDRLGNIWVSTNKGLSCFDIVENKFRNFGKRHGLVNSEYNSFSSCKLNDTTLVFGGTAGIDFINPESLLASSKVIPEILITGARINNRDTIIHDSMVVPFRMNNWEFNFTSNDFEFPQDMYFRYRLAGASDEWLNSQGNNKAMCGVRHKNLRSVSPARFIRRGGSFFYALPPFQHLSSGYSNTAYNRRSICSI